MENKSPHNEANHNNEMAQHLPSELASSPRSNTFRNSGYFVQMNEDTANSSSMPILDEDRAAQVIKKHLVTNEELEVGLSRSPGSNDGRNSILNDLAFSHQLQGGSITRDIYKWQEGQEQSNKIRRSMSVSNLAESINELPEEYQSMLAPGGFRRQFVKQKALNEGKEPPMLTRSFIDFLALYGHFAGDYYPSDEDDSDYDSGVNENTSLVNKKNKIANLATASPQKVFFLLIKSFVGTGVLFLPKAFQNGGVTFSAVAIVIVAYLALYCMLLLIESHHIVGGSYGDIGKRLFGNGARTAVLCSIVFSQFGFCCAYTIFISKNLRQVFVSVTQYEIANYWFTAAQLAVYIPMAMVRKIKYFSVAALVADVFIMSGIGYLYYFGIHKLVVDGPAYFMQFNSESYALMIGTAVFTFEGIGLVLPIAESINDPKKFPRILTVTVFISAVIFISIAVLFYLIYGDQVNGVVLLNLPQENPIVTWVQFVYALAIIFSVPLQLFPIVRILEGVFFKRMSGKTTPLIKWQKNLFRSLLVCFFAATAYFGEESLDHIVSLIGSFACVPLCFIYPSLFHYKAIKNISPAQIGNSPIPLSTGKSQELKDFALVVFGVLTMGYVTYITVTTWSG